MAGRPIPHELMIHIAACLRQARTSRSLSIEEAAERIGTNSTRLQKIELGEEQITDVEAQVMIARYGGARADRLDSLLYEWAMSEMDRESKTKRRRHLSLVADDPRPWEKIKKDWR